jgi:alkanesulfonate monooxygenase SsuD/methylene tetrahydromethanopterin reductase-like flavin-dependent oxidoreductase (luciferase family)
MERTIRAIQDACSDVPIVIGASGDRALALVARYADEWNCGARYLDQVDDRVRRVSALTAHRVTPLLRSVNLPIQLGPPQVDASARPHNLHLALHGDLETMIRRLREFRGLGFDGVWLGAQAPGAFERALELLPRIKEL